jgi:hypothetical protein
MSIRNILHRTTKSGETFWVKRGRQVSPSQLPWGGYWRRNFAPDQALYMLTIDALPRTCMLALLAVKGRRHLHVDIRSYQV